MRGGAPNGSPVPRRSIVAGASHLSIRPRPSRRRRRHTRREIIAMRWKRWRPSFLNAGSRETCVRFCRTPRCGPLSPPSSRRASDEQPPDCRFRLETPAQGCAARFRNRIDAFGPDPTRGVRFRNKRENLGVAAEPPDGWQGRQSLSRRRWQNEIQPVDRVHIESGSRSLVVLGRRRPARGAPRGARE